MTKARFALKAVATALATSALVLGSVATSAQAAPKKEDSISYNDGGGTTKQQRDTGWNIP